MKQGSFALARLCCPDRHHYYDPLRLPLGRRPLPGMTGYRQTRFPTPAESRGRGGPLQFPRQPSDRSTSPTPEGSSTPTPRQGRLPWPSPNPHRLGTFSIPTSPPGALTTLQTSLHAADRPFDPPRFDPGLSTGPGGFTTRDLCVSPDRTRTGWPSRACARYVMTTPLQSGPSELLDARGSRLNRVMEIGF